MLFADAGSAFGYAVLLIWFVVGTRGIVKCLKGNPVVGQAARKGVLSILGRMLK